MLEQPVSCELKFHFNLKDAKFKSMHHAVMKFNDVQSFDLQVV